MVLTPRARSLVTLLLWVALSQLPLGLLALLRPDAGVNSLHSLHYLVVAGIVVLVHVIETPLRTPDRGLQTSGIEKQSSSRLIGLAWGGALLATVACGFLLTARAEAPWKLYRGQEQMLATVRARPGEYYLPWNPLITLIAERKIYPFDDALLCLWKRQLAVPIEVVRAGVPAKPIIFYEEPVQSKFALTYFPAAKTP
jgi:hypothetical protein